MDAQLLREVLNGHRRYRELKRQGMVFDEHTQIRAARQSVADFVTQTLKAPQGQTSSALVISQVNQELPHRSNYLNLVIDVRRVEMPQFPAFLREGTLTPDTPLKSLYDELLELSPRIISASDRQAILIESEVIRAAF